jgi:hypothetical protein
MLHPDQTVAPDHNKGSEFSLADQLRSGALPLTSALSWAQDLATALHELHNSGQCHGDVTAESVSLNARGASLAPQPKNSSPLEPGGDLSAFGALLYEMVTGTKPASDTGEGGPAPVTIPGRENVRRAAIRLALRCLDGGAQLTMQQIATEVRLLRVLLRQWELPPALLPRRLAAPTAFTSVATPERFLVPADPAHEPRQPADIRCPLCDGLFVYSSQPRTFFERRMETARIHLYRCHRCYYRFGRFWGRVFSKEKPFA